MAVRTQLKCRYAGGVSWERKRSIRSLESIEGLKEDGARGAGREKEAAARGKGGVQSQGAGKPGAGNMSGGEPTVKCAESSARLTRSPRAGR